jgi:hypothetical protein
MFGNLFDSLMDVVRWNQLSNEERHYITSSLERLKTISNAEDGMNKSTTSKPDAMTSLFEALPGSTSERKSIGHWCMLSAAAAREERFKRVERSYEQDFPQAMNLDLDSTISTGAAHKALGGYISQSTARQTLGTPSVQGEQVMETPKLEKVFDFSSESKTSGAHDLQNLLFKMANDGDVGVRVSVASSPHAPIAAMWRLSKDARTEVRLALVDNDKLPASILKAMTHDEDLKIKRKAINRLTALFTDESGAHLPIAS